ncbi:MAG: hypothetical protein ACKOVI_06250 [Candidatus Planktophila sp.]
MKRALIAVALLSLISPSAFAAPKAIPVQLGSIYAAPVGTEMFLQSAQNTIFITNPVAQSADIRVTAVDLTNTEVWQLTIDSGLSEVAMAASVDPLGNIWIAGAAAIAPAPETATPIDGVDNPDQVTIDAPTDLRPDLSQLALWKISSSGELSATYLAPQKTIPLISSLSATNSGISIVGAIDAKPFIVTSTTSGIFGKLVVLGSSKTEFNTVVRNSDGTSSIYGSSAETLAGKKLAGIRDGVLIKVSKSGAITSLVRSSALKASRSWISGDSSYLVSGPVITGKVTETAITKFTSAFSPSWTLRLPSIGPSTTLTANGNSYLAFTSRSAIAGISGWRPNQPSLLLLTFDSKGVLKAATALPGLVTPILLAYSPAKGVVGLASASDGTVSIFTLVSR